LNEQREKTISLRFNCATDLHCQEALWNESRYIDLPARRSVLIRSADLATLSTWLSSPVQDVRLEGK
jgi:hypothetical protein